MSHIILDTDVWSFLFKQDTRAEQYRSHIEGQLPCISFQTVAELYQWVEKADWGQRRRERLVAWLQRFLVIGYDQQMGQLWGKIRADRERLGRPIAAQDAWVAACALRFDYPLLTHNAVDYQLIPQLVIISEAD
jgi:predicted nucleic acid-binding protein